MKNITLTLLAAAAMGAVSIGTASALPFSNVSAALGESDLQNVRVICGRYQRCYNSARTYRYARPYQQPRYYNNYGPVYGYGPSYGYYGRPFVGIGIGPFSLGL